MYIERSVKSEKDMETRVTSSMDMERTKSRWYVVYNKNSIGSSQALINSLGWKASKSTEGSIG